jgi:hypothetical protein
MKCIPLYLNPREILLEFTRHLQFNSNKKYHDFLLSVFEEVQSQKEVQVHVGAN